MSDRGPDIEPRDYTGAARVNLQIGREVSRKYFSRDRFNIHYQETGSARSSSTLHELVHFDHRSMCGCFISTIANSTGTVWWQRVDSPEEIAEPVARPGACTALRCLASVGPVLD